MKEFKSIDDILDFAIEKEQQAVEFYNTLAAKTTNKEMKEIFVQIAQEEIAHKAKLLKIKTDKVILLSSEKIADLKISDYMEKSSCEPSNYQETLVLAMNREKSAFKLYTRLAEKVGNTQLRDVFLSLAQEESRHKLRFEVEYDEFVLREN